MIPNPYIRTYTDITYYKEDDLWAERKAMES